MYRIFSWRLTRAHHAIDGYTCSKFIHRLICTQCLRYVRTLIQFIGIDARQLLHTSGAQFFKQHFCQFIVGFGNDFACLSIDDVLSNHAAEKVIFRNTDVCCFRLFQFACMANGDALVFGDNHFARFACDVKTRNLTTHAFSDELHLCATVHQLEAVVHKEVCQNRLRIQANCFEQNGDWHFASAVHAEIQNIFWIKLKI